MEEKKQTRKNSPPIYVRVTPDEKRAIDDMARSTGNTTAAYMRKVGLGYEVHSVLDYERVDQLAKINADLGRLGGLIKLWLTNDKRLAGYSQDDLRRILLNTLAEVQSTQAKMVDVIKTVVTS